MDSAQLFALAFGIWAGVVGLGVRLVLSHLADLAKHQLDQERRIVRLETINDRGK